MDPATIMLFASILKGIVSVVGEQMRLAGATEDQINQAATKALEEMYGMNPDTLRN